jgi:hypothetical protein
MKMGLRLSKYKESTKKIRGGKVKASAGTVVGRD